MKKPFFVLFAVLLALLSFSSHAQLDDAQTKKIDSLFLSWNQPNHPGGAIGIMKDDKVIYSKAFGLASLEYLVPNSPGTLFNTGSVSKQFTAMGIVLLHQQGKLSFDDDIRKYIPELPDFGTPITIRHLLHHTSGLRSLHALFELAGWRGDDSRTNADLNRIITKQKELNFKPGSEYLYCNTGFMLMVNIIEKVTGQKFTTWMKKNVFDALGMYQTYVEDNYSRVVPNNATSYYGSKNFDRAVEYWGYVGSGNMHSTTADLLVWLHNFYYPGEGWEATFQTMLTMDPYNDGSPNNYAFGVVVDEYLGKSRVQHGGAIGGFRAQVAAYPDEMMGIVVLTNFSAGNPGSKANQIAEILFNVDKTKSNQPEVIKSMNLSGDKLKAFAGTYWTDTQKYSRQIFVKDDTLRYARSATNTSALIPIADNAFNMLGTAINVQFIRKGNANQMIVTEYGDAPIVFNPIANTEVSTKERAEYAGTYYSPEVETSYTISVEGDSLSIYHHRHGSFSMDRLFKDILDSPMGVVQFKRDRRGAVEGIYISNGRARNVWFVKQ